MLQYCFVREYFRIKGDFLFYKVSKNIFKSFINTCRSIGGFFSGLATAQIIGAAVLITIGIVNAVFLSGYNNAVEVTYNGEKLGYVKTYSEAQRAADAVRNDAKRRGTADINFELRETVVKKNKLASYEGISTAAISRTVITDSNLTVAGLYLDGNLSVVAQDIATMQSIIDGLQQKYVSDGMVFDGFTAEVAISEISLKKSDCPQFIGSLDEFLSSGVNLGVKTHRTEEYDQTVKYTTKYTYDSTKDKSYKNTTQAGVNGLKHVVAKVYYLNGEQVSSETVSTTTLKEAVSAKVTVGSKNTTFSDIKNRLDVLNAENDGSRVTFIFPLEIRSAGYISSYWGDGRGHKGMDFATPKGTDIYAVADGVVTIATYSDSYGYYVEIKHKDGSRTRYAHASKLLVTVGQAVKQGDHIAEVGSTGRSTGNHLHFEVLINGTRVNPASYLAIK